MCCVGGGGDSDGGCPSTVVVLPVHSAESLVHRQITLVGFIPSPTHSYVAHTLHKHTPTPPCDLDEGESGGGGGGGRANLRGRRGGARVRNVVFV